MKMAFGIAFSASDCKGGKKSSFEGVEDSAEAQIQNDLPNYDKVEADKMLFGAWYGPEPTLEKFQEFKDCGFDMLFLLGHLTGWIGEEEIETSLALCDKLGIDAFVDGTHEEEQMRQLVSTYKQYSSFKGFNYDEPVIYNNIINQATGLTGLNAFVKEFSTEHPDVEFLVNLNPYSSLTYDWGTPAFTYEEYLEALETNVNVHYADKKVRTWLSCDDYPLYVNTAKNNACYLKPLWLKCLEYLAEERRKSKLCLTNHFFVQSMPFGLETDEESRNRVPTYNDLRLQLYTAMAFGYDAISFFCYATPPVGIEFTDKQYALLNANGEKTQIYYDSQKLIAELKKFSNTYMQFNKGWQGICTVLGSNNLSKDSSYRNSGFDGMQHPITDFSTVKGLQNVTATEDTVIGVLQDKDGRPGYVVVNYNETTYHLSSTVEITLDGYNGALVFVNGEKQYVTAINGKIILQLDVGEGVFIIPYNP